jgi:ribosomal protein L21E
MRQIHQNGNQYVRLKIKLMKKFMLLFAGVLFLGVTGMYAQRQDSTSMRDERQGVAALSRQSNNYTKEMMVQIQTEDIPASLRSSLQGYRYKGWENGTYYRLGNYEGYMVEINDGEKTKTFRFDPNGRPIPD